MVSTQKRRLSMPRAGKNERDHPQDSVFFADCDINGDDHCLLGVTERATCNAAILLLIHHCHASVFVPKTEQTRTHTHRNTHTHRSARIRNLVQACQGRDILIHYVRIGLLFSLTSAAATAKARQPNNASARARQHTRKCLKNLNLFRVEG